MQYRFHPFRIGFLERPGRLFVDIGIAGVNGPQPCFDPDREVEVLEFARQCHRAGFGYRIEQRLVGTLGGEALELPLHVLRDHRQGTLREIAKAVRKLGIDLVYKCFGGIAPILPEGNLGHEEVPQSIDPEPLRQFHRVGYIARRFRFLDAAVEQETVAEHLLGQR